MRPLRILIATGIYPPDLGGPAMYAKSIENEFRKMGNTVSVVYFKLEKKLPTGLRHLLYFFRILKPVWQSDFVIALDTFSVAIPAVLCVKLFRKKIIIRTGGDFLWESYVERTGDLVLLSRFYDTRMSSFNLKDRIVFRLIKFVLKSVDALVFSTVWQRDIFTPAYGLDSKKNFIIENFYGERVAVEDQKTDGKKIFIATTRPIKFKNIENLKKGFELASRFDKNIVLDIEPVKHGDFLKKITNSYAVILVSIGDISPNMILDAISVGTPFILTRENGIFERVKDIGIFVDPLSPNDIRDKILYLLRPEVYSEFKTKVKNFNFRHSWSNICFEFLSVYKKINK